MALPIAVIDRLFDRLAMTYGSEFTNKWSAVNTTEMKTIWSYELSNFADNLNAIGWALQNLTDRCPNLIEFKNLCKQAPRPDNLQLDAPKAPAEIVDSEIAKIVAKLVKPKADNVDHKRWAKLLRDKHQRGEPLSPYQIKSYKIALDIVS